jgi:peptidoglycan/xylan/chitin deacetylase (PgdA/CDA1 family)
MLTRSKRRLMARALDVTGCGQMLRALGAWRGLLILTYHRIGHAGDCDFDHDLWSATEEQLDRQLTTLSQMGDIIGLDDLELTLRAPRGRAVMLTFDDGYRDNFSKAVPILKGHGATATFFITTGFIDHPRVPWWDEIAWMVATSTRRWLPVNRWVAEPLLLGDTARARTLRRVQAVYKGLPANQTEEYLNVLGESFGTGRCPAALGSNLWMTWDMLREMQRHGMTFGAHTVNHPILANLTPWQQDEEIGQCRLRLIEELDGPIEAFSYPEGRRSSFNDATRRSLRKHGYRWAFISVGGHCRPRHQDVYAVHRASVEGHFDPQLFQATLTLPQLFA